jgi:hypothetical protein
MDEVFADDNIIVIQAEMMGINHPCKIVVAEAVRASISMQSTFLTDQHIIHIRSAVKMGVPDRAWESDSPRVSQGADDWVDVESTLLTR